MGDRLGRPRGAVTFLSLFANMTSVGLELVQQQGLRNRISPICTLSQNGYGDLEYVFPGARPFAKMTSVGLEPL